ncbi:hypothetical protein GCM10011579_063930 [Streptomyces albiflavescens]|uniref:Uncharacterized protein n=1 Tax=Streptomyces albiflavescens TaxID=1623582 RepID=A0A917Y8X6_9ACTN|nr:hypothetical protein GCM10011579_063930 [Streptomyces albiflavescens]
MCALALAACGTERAGDRSPKAGLDDRVEAGSPAPSPADSEGAEFLPFMELLVSLAEPCVKDVPAPELPDEPDPAEPPTEPVPELSVPDEPPPTSEPRDPEAAKKEVELSSVEKCEAGIHARRITKALKGTPDPTPRQVREVLRGLGYIDERIHGPQRSDESVEFTLDLRVMGGQLCLSGSAKGTRSVIEPYGASPEVGCLDVQRHR